MDNASVGIFSHSHPFRQGLSSKFLFRRTSASECRGRSLCLFVRSRATTLRQAQGPQGFLYTTGNGLKFKLRHYLLFPVPERAVPEPVERSKGGGINRKGNEIPNGRHSREPRIRSGAGAGIQGMDTCLRRACPRLERGYDGENRLFECGPNISRCGSGPYSRLLNQLVCGAGRSLGAGGQWERPGGRRRPLIYTAVWSPTTPARATS